MAWQDELGASQGRDEPVELVGTHLRLTGIVSLGRFNRVTDMINASSGYLRIRDARLLRRNGDPTNLVLPELMVDQDEISYIGQAHPAPPVRGSGADFVEPGYASMAEARKPREFVLFTPGHTVTGRVHVFGDTDLAGFVRFDGSPVRAGDRRHHALARRPSDRQPLRVPVDQPDPDDRRIRGGTDWRYHAEDVPDL